ncbi:hypothetical protein RJE46_04930 [Cedecea neteri]|uniref:hypothetical protein n=1 Tax=Cedecea neteri TaxID=158822 RepID=UPI002892C8C8|nr:hypothetical protein [Cedecea neteri]WNJ80585.1 hypothetical protein RJE46_04930 [Cedecea neteri]
MSNDEMIALAYSDSDFINWFERYFGYGPEDEIPCNHPVLVATAVAWVTSRRMDKGNPDG